MDMASKLFIFTFTSNMSLRSVMRPPGMAVRKAPAGPTDELRNLAAPCCPWVVLRPKPDRKLGWSTTPARRRR